MGAVIMATSLHAGVHPLYGLVLGVWRGLCAGFITASIHNKLKVPHLLAGILTMTMLYSVNIRILSNRANLPLLRVETLLTRVQSACEGILPPEIASLFFFILVVLGLKLALDLFF